MHYPTMTRRYFRLLVAARARAESCDPHPHPPTPNPSVEPSQISSGTPWLCGISFNRLDVMLHRLLFALFARTCVTSRFLSC